MHDLDQDRVSFAGEMASPEAIIDDARNGRMFILVDDADRENEGDLIIAGQMATPAAINFMATHGRGLICLALTEDRAAQLELTRQPRSGASSFDTAFTVSIEARRGVSTGISAADRARTVAIAVDASNGPEAIVTPGHIFPIVARDGGVLVRPGHTEAAVDVSRLAGLQPSGVICEIMGEDGTMARLPALVAFAQKHGLRIGTIRDLIAYRMRHDPLLVREDTAPLFHDGRTWQATTYRSRTDRRRHVVLHYGKQGEATPLVRVQPQSTLAALKGDNPGELGRAMAAIVAAGSGLVIIPPAEEESLQAMIDGATAQAGSDRAAIEMLHALGIGSARLLTDRPGEAAAFEALGIAIEVNPLRAADSAKLIVAVPLADSDWSWGAPPRPFGYPARLAEGGYLQ